MMVLETCSPHVKKNTKRHSDMYAYRFERLYRKFETNFNFESRFSNEKKKLTCGVKKPTTVGARSEANVDTLLTTPVSGLI